MLSMAVMPNAFAATNPPTGFVVTGETSYRCLGGLTERFVTINKPSGDNQVENHILEFNGKSGSNISLLAGYNDCVVNDDGTLNGWKMARVSEQAAAMEQARGVLIVGGVNASGFDTKTGEPSGTLVMNGKIIKQGNGSCYIGTLKDTGEVIISDSTDLSNLQEAVSGIFGWLVKDGKVVQGLDNAQTAPRTAVGLKADGTVVLLVADGRQKPQTCGFTLKELADTMFAMGCVKAINMDGGASSTLISRREADNNIVVRNSPSGRPTGPRERVTGASVLLAITAKATNVFDHVSFSQEVYRCNPSSYVKVNPIAVDVNGFQVDLPENGKIEVADANLGSVKNNKFRAKGVAGKTEIRYVVDGETVGTALVEITPDEPTVVEAFIRNIIQEILSFIQRILSKWGLLR